MSAAVLEQARGYVGRRGPTVTGADAVDPAMIRHWCRTLGDANPVYRDEQAARASVHGGVIAPPAMLQAWTMPDFGDRALPGDLTGELYAILDRAGYTSILATNSEQEYVRPLRPGDRVSATKTIDSISDEKRTAVGSGFFVTSLIEVTNGDGQLVGRQLHRVLKFRPERKEDAPPAAPAARRPRPVVTQDTAFFWDAARERRLLIQRCAVCGTLRHPPTPACARCGALDWDTVESGGRGELYSYTIVHAPVVPPFAPPYVVALVELEEGTRLVSELVDVDPAAVLIGMPLRLDWLECDEDLTLPVFRPAGALPTLRIPLTRSFIVATAIASRDYQEVHHDPDVARARGSEDVFMNILTSNGLVARYVTDWAGPDAVLRKIAIRLGAPNYPGDTMELTGAIVADDVDGDGRRLQVDVRAHNRRGDHLTGTVHLTVPAGNGGGR